MNNDNSDKKEMTKPIDPFNQDELWQRVAGEALLGAVVGKVVCEINPYGAAVGTLVATAGWILNSEIAELDRDFSKIVNQTLVKTAIKHPLPSEPTTNSNVAQK